MDNQEFCLRWNNHQSTLISVFDSLLENETLVDVTLAAEGKFLRAHRLVLCACSAYFQEILAHQPEKHVVVYMKDVRFEQLKALMSYMYRGEVNVAQDQLSSFIQTAESLRIKGLADGGDKKKDRPSAPQAAIASMLTATQVRPQITTSTPVATPTAPAPTTPAKSPEPEPAPAPAPPTVSSPTVTRRSKRQRRNSHDNNNPLSTNNNNGSPPSSIDQPMVYIPNISMTSSTVTPTTRSAAKSKASQAPTKATENGTPVISSVLSAAEGYTNPDLDKITTNNSSFEPKITVTESLAESDEGKDPDIVHIQASDDSYMNIKPKVEADDSNFEDDKTGNGDIEWSDVEGAGPSGEGVFEGWGGDNSNASGEGPSGQGEEEQEQPWSNGRHIQPPNFALSSSSSSSVMSLWACSRCNRTFKTDLALRLHVRSSCSPDKGYFCSQCPFRGQRRRQVIVHMLQAHDVNVNYKAITNGRKPVPALPFMCARCGKSYKNRNTLKVHQRYNCGTPPARHTCSLCDYCTYNKSHLMRHLECIHRVPRNDKPSDNNNSEEKKSDLTVVE